jgi:hypothetical protein
VIRMWWRKRRQLLLRVLPTDSDHAARVSEAESAIREGNKKQVEVNHLSDAMTQMSDELEKRGRKNHFSELVTEMLHNQGGGTAPAPRRG